ncbi:MAG: AbrB/MazE/SpoVT family DNA-binding domain-containing protein [Candidatus Aenigmarchaeota archaeon]|nr:AbrB/MazE/SpoVT family DNA-binding domain-containing protein [Candidatus Aenigmarchaeota archaeon]
MPVETVRMSSKGQIVIPQDIREEINADEGTVFAVTGSRDAVILKKIGTPSKEELIKQLHVIAKEGKKRLQSRNIKEGDMQK